MAIFRSPLILAAAKVHRFTRLDSAQHLCHSFSIPPRVLLQVQRATLEAEDAALVERQLQLAEGQAALRGKQARTEAAQRRLEGLARAEGIWVAATQASAGATAAAVRVAGVAGAGGGERGMMMPSSTSAMPQQQQAVPSRYGGSGAAAGAAAASLSSTSSANATPADSIGSDSGGGSGAEGRAGRQPQLAASSLAQLPPLLQDSTPMAAQRGGGLATTAMLDGPGEAFVSPLGVSGMLRGGSFHSEHSSPDAAPSDTPLLGSVQPRAAGEGTGVARASSSSFLGGGFGGGGLGGGLALGSSISVAASLGSAANSVINIDGGRSVAMAARARPSATASSGAAARPPSSSSAASRLLLASFQHQAERGAERVQRLGRIVSALAGDGGAGGEARGGSGGGGRSGGDPEIRQQVG